MLKIPQTKVPLTVHYRTSNEHTTLCGVSLDDLHGQYWVLPSNRKSAETVDCKTCIDLLLRNQKAPV